MTQYPEKNGFSSADLNPIAVTNMEEVGRVLRRIGDEPNPDRFFISLGSTVFHKLAMSVHPHEGPTK